MGVLFEHFLKLVILAIAMVLSIMGVEIQRLLGPLPLRLGLRLLVLFSHAIKSATVRVAVVVGMIDGIEGTSVTIASFEMGYFFFTGLLPLLVMVFLQAL